VSSRWTKAWKNAPGLDCGLCGRGICSGFVRAYLNDLIEIDSCPLFSLSTYSTHRDSLIKLREEGIKSPQRPAPEHPENGVLFTRPCKDTDEKVMAELRISNGVKPGEMIEFMVFSPELLCKQLDLLSSMFDSIRCSKELGYARADYGEMSITFLNDGRVNMRRVENEAQVRDLFSKFECILQGSVVCNCCGSDTYSILSGLVKPIKADTHAVLESNIPINLKQTANIIQSTGSSRLDSSLLQLRDQISLIHNTLETNLMNPELQWNASESKSLISNIERTVVDHVGISASSKLQSQIVHILMLMIYSRIALRSLSWLNNADIHLKQQVIDILLTDEVDALTVESEMLEVYAHSSAIIRAIRLLSFWITQ